MESELDMGIVANNADEDREETFRKEAYDKGFKDAARGSTELLKYLHVVSQSLLSEDLEKILKNLDCTYKIYNPPKVRREG